MPTKDKSLEPVTEDAPSEDKPVEKTAADPTPSNTIAGIKIERVGDVQEGFNALIYGIPGAGKTRLLGSAYDVEWMRPVLYVDIEGGYETIREMYPDMHRVRVKTDADSKGRVRKSAWSQLKDLHEAARRGDGGYQTILIDNLSEAYQLAMSDIMAKVVADDPERDPDVPSQREWGKASSQIRKWVRDMRDLNMNVIFAAHETQHTTESGAVLRYTPSLPGKLANEISAYMDFVLYLYTKDERGDDKKTSVVRMLQTQPAGKFVAKDRSGKLPLVMRDPTMTTIMEVIKDATPDSR